MSAWLDVYKTAVLASEVQDRLLTEYRQRFKEAAVLVYSKILTDRLNKGGQERELRIDLPPISYGEYLNRDAQFLSGADRFVINTGYLYEDLVGTFGWSSESESSTFALEYDVPKPGAQVKVTLVIVLV